MAGEQECVLALDLGSSSVRTLLVSADGQVVSEARESVSWQRPHPGWVEVDPQQLWRSQLDTIRRVTADQPSTSRIAACAVTSHRETVLLWDRHTGEPVHNAIVWISTQTDEIVAGWQALGLDGEFRRRTGLRNDSFFSAAKIVWVLENVPGARARAEAGELACGTIDSWLVWNLTGGRVHSTDPSCASRTALLNLESLAWDEELCAMLDIPVGILPAIEPSDGDFGAVDGSLPGAGTPIRAVLADQQAGMFGQACFAANSAKNTFGTAGVLTVNAGSEPRLVEGLTTSVGWATGAGVCYELEGVVFSSGQTLQWLRDGLQLIVDVSEVEALATSVASTAGVHFVPAFSGLCAPYWNRNARASLTGVTLETTRAHVVRAAVEAMAFLTVDILATVKSGGVNVSDLKVDGGAAHSDFLCQFLADVSGLAISRPRELERTALGAAYLAGIGVGMWKGQADIEASWQAERVFDPQIGGDRRQELYEGWTAAVQKNLA
ncbi:MAG: glycerol kinase GlpK [Nitrospiraceae bacterium]|nr:glycerol kinase GlpK [Nitrospiraceae bacterium]